MGELQRMSHEKRLTCYVLVRLVEGEMGYERVNTRECCHDISSALTDYCCCGRPECVLIRFEQTQRGEQWNATGLLAKLHKLQCRGSMLQTALHRTSLVPFRVSVNMKPT